MKNKILKIVLSALVILSVYSCTDYFDTVPDESLSLDATFQNRDLTLRFLANVYSYIPNEFQQRVVNQDNHGATQGIWTAASMEADYTWSDIPSNLYNIGAVDPMTGWVEVWWRNYYKGIQKANVFMANVDKNPEMNEGEILRYKTEARALRAIYYFWILKIYGPFVIVGDEIYDPEAPSSEMLFPRSSLEECFKYILDELAAVYNSTYLTSSFKSNSGEEGPAIVVDSEHQGNMTMEIVEAIRSQVLLYAASPLYNGDSYYRDLMNHDGTPLFPQSENLEKWKAARDAAKTFIESYPYSLTLLDISKKDVSSVSESCPYTSTREAVIGDNKDNREMIFYRTGAGGNQFLYYDMTPKHTVPGIDGGYRGGGGLGITQEMVDMYFTNKGLRIEEDPDYFQYTNDEVGASITRLNAAYRDPYSGRTYIDGKKRVLRQYYNREPRFYLGVTFNNQWWWFFTNSGSIYSEFNYNGNSGAANNGNDYPKTGMLVRKKKIDGAWAQDGRYGILIRLAEIYLNYAEAANECDDMDEAIKYVNKIRARAGIPEYKGRVGADATQKDERGNDRIVISFDKETIRNIVRRERLIELAFESHRYFDVRRWNVAGMQTSDGWVYPSYHVGGEGGEMHGFSVREDGYDYYKKIVFERRTFSEKMKFMPIPQADISRNPYLIQNKGWVVD